MTTQKLIALAQQLESELRATAISFLSTDPLRAPILLTQATHASGIVEALQSLYQLRVVEKILSPAMREKLSRLGTTEDEFRIVEKLKEKLDAVVELPVTRPEPPQPEYRMLEVGEAIRHGDEWCYGGIWEPCSETAFTLVIAQGDVGCCRRPITRPTTHPFQAVVDFHERECGGNQNTEEVQP